MAKFNYTLTKERRFGKLSLKEKADLIFDLINAFALTRTPMESAMLLEDLLTENEVKNLAKRLRIAKLLLENKNIREIATQLHCSFATVAKVGIWLNNSGEGLRKVISRLPERKVVYRPNKTPGVGYGLPQILLHLGSMHLKDKESKYLRKFIEEMGVKTTINREFRETSDQELRAKKK